MSAFTPTKAFRRCQSVTARWEGGWSNDPADRGGKTMYGITQATFDGWRDSRGEPRQSVRTITRDEARQIFFTNYWLAAGCNTLVAGVDLATYDASVNSGVSRGRKWLMASLSPTNDHVATVKAICAKRLGFVESLKSFARFGRGWTNRIADVQAKGVAWAATAMHSSGTAKQWLEDEAGEQKKKARTKTATGGTAGAATGAGAGDIAVHPDHAQHLAGNMLAVLIAAGVLIALFLVWRGWQHRKQAEAYAREAEGVA